MDYTIRYYNDLLTDFCFENLNVSSVLFVSLKVHCESACQICKILKINTLYSEKKSCLPVRFFLTIHNVEIELFLTQERMVQFRVIEV